ncbi:hypothetical protein [Agrobacterium arsenijevicii]|uniref:hypothetical protein n=1 Tax=Agrobacterium arsenijevicii TaxID=1585697 RepID=UPI0005D39E8F
MIFVMDPICELPPELPVFLPHQYTEQDNPLCTTFLRDFRFPARRRKSGEQGVIAIYFAFSVTCSGFDNHLR